MVVYLDQETERQLRRILQRRFESLSKRCTRLNIPPPRRKEFIELLVQRIRQNGLICHYCVGDVNIYTSQSDFRTALSIDHRIPLSEKIDSTSFDPHGMGNIAICCYRCNLAKGVMSYETFVNVVKVLRESSPALLESFLDESFRANLANKLERVGWEKQQASGEIDHDRDSRAA